MNYLKTTIDGTSLLLSEELIAKYSGAVPRYTSYPPIPSWHDHFGIEEYKTVLLHSNNSPKPLSFYFHIPFCEQRCTFCACNAIATPQHEIADRYLQRLQKEIATVARTLDNRREVVQLHWGGGTPTYLNCRQMEELYRSVQKYFHITSNAEISVEIDPRVTTDEQLTTLNALGFNRVSLGVQDFEPAVQQAIGRIQPVEQTRHVIEKCRELGMKSVHCDLVLGLPSQTFLSFQKTLQTLLELDPDRVSLFHFGYVPKMHPHQRKIDPKTLPDTVAKMKMFCEAIETLQAAGFEFIGLDHFAKSKDELNIAKKKGGLHRSFQGHSAQTDADLIGFGTTGISQTEIAFAQNSRKLKEYEEAIDREGLAVNRGMMLSQDDKIRQSVIAEIMCHQKIDKTKFKNLCDISFDDTFAANRNGIENLAKDELITNRPDTLTVTPLGRLFLRQIASTFDFYFQPGR